MVRPQHSLLAENVIDWLGGEKKGLPAPTLEELEKCSKEDCRFCPGRKTTKGSKVLLVKTLDNSLEMPVCVRC